MGANFVIFLFGTSFFGGAFIIPIGYLIAGFLPNLMGHFLGLFMLYVFIKTRLRRFRQVFFCSFLGVLLILSHLIASITYLAALISLFISSLSSKEEMHFKEFGILLVLSIAISSPWWVQIVGELLLRPQLFLLTDAGYSWIQHGLSAEIIEYYGLIPFFSLLGIIHFRTSKLGSFLSLWLLMLFPFLFTRWGFRFALEITVPLYMLGAIGVSRVFKQILFCKKTSYIARCIIFILIVMIICEALRLFDALLIYT
jgi:hypothetical protein